MPERLRIEVVFALPEHQALVSVSLEKGATVADAITKSELTEQFSEQQLDSMPVGIWGRPADRSTRLKDGDRVEIYRALERDPRDARRMRAQAGLTMRKSTNG